MKKICKLLLAFTLFLVFGISCASAEEISFDPSEISIDVGSTQEVDILVDSLPKGLSGYDITVTVEDPSVAQITAVSYPSWAVLHGELLASPASSIVLSGVDLMSGVGIGDKTVLATITVERLKLAATEIDIEVNQVDDDNGNVIDPTLKNLKITVADALVADFTANETEGEAPFTVQFTDASSNAVKWAWDFDNDGTVDSTEQNPSFNYDTVGTYTVNLTVTNKDGSDTEIKADYITANYVPVYPVAYFSADVTEGDAPLTVTFTDESSDATGWAWDFDNDGTVDSTEQNPSFNYDIVGTYTVNLTVTNKDGSDTEMKADYITANYVPVYPVADFSADVTEGDAPLTVTFTDESSDATGWAWDFDNDGTVDSTEQNPGFNYDIVGTYTVNLTVTNSDGSNTKIKADYITANYVPVYPVANFSADVTEGDAPLTVTFTDESSDATGWAWDFDNDGTVDSTEQNPSFNYDTLGTYTVNLTVTNNDGSDTEIKADYITANYVPVYPVADFSADVTEGNAPLTVTFTDESSDATGWAWDFDNDGNVDSTEQNPSFNYDTVGTYTVNLTVTNSDGSDTEIKADYITANYVPVYPVANFSADVTEGNAPLTVTFTDESSDATGWAWDFDNDGTVDSTEQNPSFNYDTLGTYTVNLTVENELGTTNTTTETITVYGLPVANFTVDDNKGEAPFTIQFTDASENAVAWFWDFGGEGSSTDPSPEFTFETPGEYTVTLTVKNGMETEDNTTKTITIYGLPVSDFEVNASSGIAPLTVNFTDLSENAIEWFWDFGDESTSNDQNPIHQYTSPGCYDVNLTVSNGWSDNLSTLEIVVTKKIESSLNISAEINETKQEITFNDNANVTVSRDNKTVIIKNDGINISIHSDEKGFNNTEGYNWTGNYSSAELEKETENFTLGGDLGDINVSFNASLEEKLSNLKNASITVTVVPGVPENVNESDFQLAAQDFAEGNVDIIYSMSIEKVGLEGTEVKDAWIVMTLPAAYVNNSTGGPDSFTIMSRSDDGKVTELDTTWTLEGDVYVFTAYSPEGFSVKALVHFTLKDDTVKTSSKGGSGTGSCTIISKTETPSEPEVIGDVSNPTSGEEDVAETNTGSSTTQIITPKETETPDENIPTSEEETETEKQTPGFGLVFAAFGLVSMLCLLKRSKKE